MRRRDHSLSVALALSLAIHAAVLVMMRHVDWPHGTAGRIRLAARGFDPVTSPVYIDQPEPIRADRIGERIGRGTGINAAPGDWPQLAREGDQDQAALSRDPQGMGSIFDAPVTWTGPTGETGTGGDGQPLIASADHEPMRFGLPSADLPVPPARPPQRTRDFLGPAPQEADSPPAGAAPESRPLASMSADGTGPAGAPGAGRSADPYVQSDAESDPFAKQGSASVRGGRLEAQFGRKVKTVRPRLDVGGVLDLPTLRYPTVQLRVKTDASGRVVLVEILQSSGSAAIDHPTRLAMYDWWIEPPTDKDGNPLPDVMVWTIHFR